MWYFINISQGTFYSEKIKCEKEILFIEKIVNCFGIKNISMLIKFKNKLPEYLC